MLHSLKHLRPILMATLVGCPKPQTSPETSGDTAWRSTKPEPLAVRDFQLPVPTTGSLSNGIPVVVVENHEVPLVYVRLTLNVGGFTDPADLTGQASATMDMLNEGAGEMNAAGISNELRRLGSSLGSSAGSDGSQVGLTTLKSRLEPSLDLMATVALEPTFPEEDWELMRSKRVQDLEAARKDPGKMSSRVWSHLMYGEHYLGLLSSEASYEAMETAQLRDWYDGYFVPDNAIFLVGGDTSLDEILPQLESRFGHWKPDVAAEVMPADASRFSVHEGSTIFLVDSPGAAQSVVRVGTFVGSRTEPDYAAFTLANHVVGGQFIARINLNLREDKGWTYGARSSTYHNYLPGLWSVRSSIVTEHTVDAMKEILREITESQSERPITLEELVRSKEGILGTRPLSFEQPGYLLDRTRDMNRYGLPEDWISGYEDRFRSVSLEEAQSAWVTRIDPEQLTWVIVGDVAQIEPELAELGIPIVRIDANGIPLP